MSISPHCPTPLTERIYAELKRRILTCVLHPGERLIEKTLCEDLGVSRASLRESLNRLAQEKLVTQRPNAGFRVTPITPDGFRNICELRRVVESEVAALAAERAGKEDILSMREAATLRIGADDPNAYREYVSANFAFHHAIARSIENPLLEEIVVSALEKDQQPIYYGIDLGVCTNPEEITREHHAIVDAIEAHDAKLARKRMAAHIGKKEARIVSAASRHREED